MLAFLGEMTSVEHQPVWVLAPAQPESFVELDNYGMGTQTVEIEYVGVEATRRRFVDPLPVGDTGILRVLAIYDANPVPEESRTIDLPAVDQSRVYEFENFNNNSGEKLRVRITAGAVDREFQIALGVLRLGLNPAGEVRSEGQDID
jgi:hypothetical protein